ncbi:metallophosphoesterase family protein [Weissella minor]|uniref:metallophosphoesterase family protein n=1 Tax=Weissella minor TaxID=1620 RepID=UPI001BAE892D|nr:metallophosphoesterase family protein [Weissella minor]MBS0949293.1 metallophosphoesterase family protein [Weissella minor]
MTKIAVLSDVHGNLTALEAFVADIQQQPIDESWFLGDLVLPGYGGNHLFELLKQINTTVYLRGNWDDIFLEVLDNPEALDLNDPEDVYCGILAKYVFEHLDEQYLTQMREAPIATTVQINGLQIGLSHNTSMQNYGRNLVSDADTTNLDQLFNDQALDLAIYGHIHHQLMRYSHADQLILNPGSVDQPYSNYAAFQQDRRAQYAILEIDERGIVDVQFKKIDYDLQNEAKNVQYAAAPYADLYQRLILDDVNPRADVKALANYNQDHHYLPELQQFIQTQHKN